MKRLRIIVGLSILFLLSGCMNPTSVRIVEDMYRAAIIEDDTEVESYFSEEFRLENDPFSEVIGKLNADAVNMEGVAFMSTRELRERDLNPEIVENLKEKYNDEWNYIVSQVDDDQIMTWIVQRGETQYYIVDGKEYHVDDYNKYVLGNS